MRDAVDFLAEEGDVLSGLEGELLHDHVVIDPEWLTGTMLAAASMPQELRAHNAAIVVADEAEDGRVPVRQIAERFPDHPARTLIALYHHFGLCLDAEPDAEGNVRFPGLASRSVATSLGESWFEASRNLLKSSCGGCSAGTWPDVLRKLR